MVEVPWPLTNNPGLKSQEGTGRLINVFPEPTENDSAGPVWRRVPGATVFARSPSSGTINIDFDVRAVGQTMFSTFFEFVGSSTTQNAGSSVNSITYPAGTLAGDVVFIASAGDSTVANPTTPTDWTALGSSSTFMMNHIMYKVCTGETTVDLTWGSTEPWVSLAFAIRGCDTANVIVDTPTVSTGASLDPVPPNITNTTANSLLVNISFQDDDAATAVVAPTTVTIAAAATYGFGGHLFAVSTGASGTDAATVMAGFKFLGSTGAITASSWAVTNGDDEWRSVNFTVRHD